MRILCSIAGAVAMACFGLVADTARAGDLFGVTFESGNVGSFGGPAVNGWEIVGIDEVNGTPNPPTIGSTGRTFLTGTPGNDEALFINPYEDGADGQFTDSGGTGVDDYQGVVFRPDAPISVPAGSNVYMIMEHFSDIALDESDIKLRMAAGVEGNGGGFLNFDSTINDTYRTEVSYEILTNGRERSLRAQSRNSLGQAEGGEYFRDAHWDRDDVTNFGDPLNNIGGDQSNNFLDRSYKATVLFRPEDSFMDLEAQVADSFGVVTNQDESFDRDGNDPAFPQVLADSTDIDYFVLGMARHYANGANGVYDGPGGPNVDGGLWKDPIAYSSNAVFSNGDPATAPESYVLDNAEELQIGVKSVRFGIADPGDFNLDGVVDGVDEALATANLGVTEGATFFDGDNDGDGDVDADDLSIFVSDDLLGDADGDGDVDGDDLIAVQTEFGSTGATPLLGDADFDGDVDGDDLIAVQTEFGNTASSVAVPEPTSALLVAAGLAGLLGRRRSGC